MLVEGGGELASALLRADLVDEVHWLLAPKLIGSDGRPGLGPLEIDRLVNAIDLEVHSIQRRGPDFHLHGEIRRSGIDIESGRRGRHRKRGKQQ